ncbi:MAG: cobyrinate a,c-diamide synthase [Pseudomonadota bacterium]
MTLNQQTIQQETTNQIISQANGLIIGATGSHCGKTTVTAMLLAALTQRNILIQPYKIGADFFDPGMHCMYSNEVSLNLDSWIMNTDNIVNIIAKLPDGYRGIVEGWGGIFEQQYPDLKQSSTMEIAHLLNWPILLVICCFDKDDIDSDSIISLIQKAGLYKGQKRIIGVILNRVRNQNFADKLIQELNQNGIITLGCIIEQKALEHSQNIHHNSDECKQDCPSPKKLASIAEQYLDLDGILALITINKNARPAFLNLPEKTNNINKKKRIAISNDNAFFFYYQDNSDFLLQYNVDIIEFSPLKDKQLPENLDGLILSGGIPEIYAEQLANNELLRQDIKSRVDDGLLCYAECGGLMFLCQGIYLRNGQFYPMIGCMPGIVELTNTLQNFGYALCKTQINNQPVTVRGHEYHYARWLEEEKFANLWQTTTCKSNLSRMEGYKEKNIHASFVHLYFPTAEQLICDFFKLKK